MKKQEIIKILKKANLDGWGGDCGATAIAINKVLFNNKGKYLAGINSYLYEKGYFIGHVAVEFDNSFFDSSGETTKEKVESWGQIDPLDNDISKPDRQIGEQGEKAELIYLDEFDLCVLLDIEESNIYYYTKKLNDIINPDFSSSGRALS